MPGIHRRRRPRGADIRTCVLPLAGLRGQRPNVHCALPGNDLLWQTDRRLQMMVRYRQVLRRGPL